MNLKFNLKWAFCTVGLTAALLSCNQTSSYVAAPTSLGTPPLARETALFEFTRAIPAGKPVYLVFVDSDKKIIASYPLEANVTKKEIDISNLSKPATALLKPALSFLSLTAKITSGPTPSDAQIYPLSPLIYQDKNDNKLVDDGEVFLTTKDQVVYSTKAFVGSYTDTLAGSPLEAIVYVNAGWSQLEYYLYGLLADTNTYRLVLSSTKISNFTMKDSTVPGSI